MRLWKSNIATEVTVPSALERRLWAGNSKGRLIVTKESEGKVALVAGAGSGIGRSTALAFAIEGNADLAKWLPLLLTLVWNRAETLESWEWVNTRRTAWVNRPVAHPENCELRMPIG